MRKGVKLAGLLAVGVAAFASHADVVEKTGGTH